MILFEHDLWGHIPWGSTIFCVVYWYPFLSNAEVCEAEISIFIENKIFWFYVPVNDTLVVDCLQGLDQASDEELGLVWRKLSYLDMMIPQVSAFHHVHHKV